MPPSTQKKIRDLERLKKKLICKKNENADSDESITTSIEEIDAKIAVLETQKEENKKNENKLKEKNKIKRKQSNELLKQNRNNTEPNQKKNVRDNSDVNKDNKVPTVKKTETSTHVPTPVATPAPVSIEEDAFFMNPDAAKQEHKKDTNDSRKRKAEELYVSVDNITRYSQNSNYVHKRMLNSSNGIVDRLAFVDTSKMTKQELRLHKWKMKEFAKRQGRSASVFGGMDFHKDNTDNEKKDKSKSIEQSKDKTNPNKKLKTDTGKMKNASRAPNSKIFHNGKILDPKPSVKPVSSNTLPDSNLGFGGVSANAVTETVKNKQTGAIVQAQGKKISFD